jgi:oxygen-dependent protoporphyrinogen oxidase
MKRVLVVGGGVSGTAAAWTMEGAARQRDLALEIQLVEREREFGGKALSISEDEWLFEAGPLGFMNNEPALDELVSGADLGGELLPSSPAAAHRFVYCNGKVREVSAQPWRFAASGILGLGALARLGLEPFVPRKKTDGDESVWAFAQRRLGTQFADRLIHPMVLGVFAGDAKALSLPSAFPLMAELERDHGSLIRAQIVRARQRRNGELPSERPTLCTFRDGMQTLPQALVKRGGFASQTNAAVTALWRRSDGRWGAAIGGDSGEVTADAVILACEGWQAASLLKSVAPDVAVALNEVEYPPIYVVALGFSGEARRSIPPGFGVLIPRDAGYRALGVTGDSSMFANRSGDDCLLVRVLLGGTFDPTIAELSSGEVIELAARELRSLFRTDVRPVFARAKLWPKAIPQYSLGHGERVARVERSLVEHPGLFIAGNSLAGTSFGKAAARGAACGHDAVVYLSRLAQLAHPSGLCEPSSVRPS